MFKFEFCPTRSRCLTRGSGEMADVTVIMGPPRAGKSLFLALLYGLSYYSRQGRIPGFLRELAESYLGAGGHIGLETEDGVVRCESTADGVSCTADARRQFMAYLLYEGLEYTLRFRHCAPPDERGEVLAYIEKAVMKKAGERYPVAVRGGELWEEVGGRHLPIRHSSNAVVLVGVLERLASYASEGEMLLLDGTLDGLYPDDAAYLAYRIAQAASRGARAVVATHLPLIYDLFNNLDAVAEYLRREKLRVETAGWIFHAGEITPADYNLTPYGRVLMEIYSKIYR
ncbi:ATPase [Thermoproteus tenax]|nr:ATPase [Thermoproteus tenax]